MGYKIKTPAVRHGYITGELLQSYRDDDSLTSVKVSLFERHFSNGYNSFFLFLTPAQMPITGSIHNLNLVTSGQERHCKVTLQTKDSNTSRRDLTSNSIHNLDGNYILNLISVVALP